MKYQIKINSVNTIEDTDNYWSTEDYIKLLEKFNFPEGEKAAKESLKELLFMAITDFEPNEAAALVLEYKLSDRLSHNQILQISNDMLLDKISEEYPDISLHAELFHINQLLFKAFNGKFPNTKATSIDCSITSEEGHGDTTYSKEKILKLLSAGLSDSTLIKRLFSAQLSENKPFPEAESILWEVVTSDNKNFYILTSNYWLNKDDIISEEFDTVFVELVEIGPEH